MLASQPVNAGAADCDSSAAASGPWPAACSATTRSISGLVRFSCALMAASASFSSGSMSVRSANRASSGPAERA